MTQPSKTPIADYLQHLGKKIPEFLFDIEKAELIIHDNGILNILTNIDVQLSEHINLSTLNTEQK
jgi:hypothetical protein